MEIHVSKNQCTVFTLCSYILDNIFSLQFTVIHFFFFSFSKEQYRGHCSKSLSLKPLPDSIISYCPFLFFHHPNLASFQSFLHWPSLTAIYHDWPHYPMAYFLFQSGSYDERTQILKLLHTPLHLCCLSEPQVLRLLSIILSSPSFITM